MLFKEYMIHGDSHLEGEKSTEDFESIIEKMRVLHYEDDIDRKYEQLEQKRINRWKRKIEFSKYLRSKNKSPKINNT